MTSEQQPVEGGTTAYQESLRPPGQSLPPTDAENAGDTDDFFDDDPTDDERAREESIRRAGYDPAAVSGDTEAVRPQ